jgi:HAD superfamily hydrolase (TIGR01509 family)
MPTPLSPDAIVFDLDDLLVDTSGAWDHAYAALFSAHGAQLHRDDRKRLSTLAFGQLGHGLARLLGYQARPQDLLDQLVVLLSTNAGRPVAPMPGAAELVPALAVSYPLAIATNSPTKVACQHLTTLGLLHCFTVVVGIDHVQRPKPAPDLYAQAARELRLHPARAVAVEDSQIGLDSAHAARYGYTIGISHQGQHLHADAVFTSLADPNLWKMFGVAPVQR